MNRYTLIAIFTLACGGTDPGDNTDSDVDCLDCGDDEVCITLAVGDDFDDWTNTCEPAPSTCSTVDCTDCISELYDMCPEDLLGSACSDTNGLPVIVTCND